MRAHASVLAAGSQRDTEVLLQPDGGGIQIACAEDEVIGFDHRHPQSL